MVFHVLTINLNYKKLLNIMDYSKNMLIIYQNILLFIFSINILEIFFYSYFTYKNISNDDFNIVIYTYSFFINFVSCVLSIIFSIKLKNNIKNLLKKLNYYFAYNTIIFIININILYFYLIENPMLLINIFIYNINTIIYYFYYFYFRYNSCYYYNNLFEISNKKECDCCICLDSIKFNEKCHLFTCCNNKIHLDCLYLLLSYINNLTCPYCRHEYRY